LDRRQALEMIGIGAGVASLAIQGNLAVAAEDNATQWVDCHSHIWTRDVKSFPLANGNTVDDLAPPSFTDDELLAVAQPQGVARVVLIQHRPYHGYDNSYCIAAARKRPEAFRVVGMLDDALPKVAERMHALLAQKVTAFRITPRTSPDTWLTSAGGQEMWKTGAKTGQAMCCLIDAQQLGPVDMACQRHPDTPVVIDHFARIGVDGIIRDADVKSLCRLARHRHTHVKLSAFYALGKKKPPHDDLRPMIQALLDAFGPERLMWGTDCPYQINADNNYESSVAFMKSVDLSVSDREWVMKKTAEKVFFGG
jgi:predicted TIM-barrel fold metal-dependent hydrolase